MIVHLYRFFKDDLIHLKGDHVWCAADGSRVCPSCFIKPGQHLASEEIIIDADIAGFANLRGYKFHLSPFFLILQHGT